MDHADLTRRFAYHPATTDAVRDAHAQMRASCLSLAGQLDVLLPEGREKSLAITNLEQVMMWANAAIARHGAPRPATPEQARDALAAPVLTGDTSPDAVAEPQPLPPR